MQKKMYKVLCPIEKKDGGTYWMRIGSGFENRDNSINMYLDVMPTKPGSAIQIRELDEEDLRRRETARVSHTNPGNPPPAPGTDAVPF